MKFSISTNRIENTLGYCYLAFYQIFLPSLIGTVSYLVGTPISPSLLNIIFFLINFTAVALIFRRFLAQSLLSVKGNIKYILISVIMGLVIYFVAGFFFGLITPWIDPNFSNVNDNAILDMTREYGAILSFCIVVLVPVVEETIFRGLIFRHLYQKNKLIGYCVSIAVFSLIHVAGYIGTEDFTTLLLCFIQYIPAGYALAGAYERTGNICAPIVTHITINLIGLLLLR